MTVLNDFIQGTNDQGLEHSWTALPPEMVRAGLDDILGREYFRRLWIVQETAIAREVMLVCGDHHLGWMNEPEIVFPFMRRLKAAAISPQWRSTGVETCRVEVLIDLLQMQLDTGPHSATWEERRPALDLLDIAYEARDKKSTDPRDRIFALLSLANRTKQSEIRADYTLSVEEVHRQMEFQLLSSSSNDRIHDTDTLFPSNHRDQASVEDQALLDAERDAWLSVDSPAVADITPRPNPPADPQLDILLNDLTTTFQRTQQLIGNGGHARAACLLESLARDVRSCADTMKG